jgi:hypothetical protein
VFVDLVDELQKLPKPEAATLFISEGFAAYYGNVAHHYSNYGNEYVAKKVYRQLISIPEVSARLEQIRDAPVREVKADAR